LICPNPDCPDIELFGVRGEYGEGVVTCPKCGTRLVKLTEASAEAPPVGETPTETPAETVAESRAVTPAESPFEAEEVASESAEPVEPALEHEIGSILRDPDTLTIALQQQGDDALPLMAFNYRYEAEPFRALLHSAGLPALVTTDDLGCMSPPLGFVHEVVLWVRSQDLEAAEGILDAEADLEPHDSKCVVCCQLLAADERRQLSRHWHAPVHESCSRREEISRGMLRAATTITIIGTAAPSIPFLLPMAIILSALIIIYLNQHPALELPTIGTRAIIIILCAIIPAGIAFIAAGDRWIRLLQGIGYGY
jgi:uncharacterized Zn finger protein (UPF0148 family)